MTAHRWTDAEVARWVLDRLDSGSGVAVVPVGAGSSRRIACGPQDGPTRRRLHEAVEAGLIVCETVTRRPWGGDGTGSRPPIIELHLRLTPAGWKLTIFEVAS